MCIAQDVLRLIPRRFYALTISQLICMPNRKRGAVRSMGIAVDVEMRSASNAFGQVSHTCKIASIKSTSVVEMGAKAASDFRI